MGLSSWLAPLRLRPAAHAAPPKEEPWHGNDDEVAAALTSEPPG